MTSVKYNGQEYLRSTDEGAVVRASNGWLVAALRTIMPPRLCVDTDGFSDNLDGTGVSISKDNGETWSPVNVLFESGWHHANLERLPNDDLIMTMIMRLDMPLGGDVVDSYTRGLVALVSHDNGVTWNLDQQFALDEFSYYNPDYNKINPWLDATCGHAATTILNDGSIQAAYGNDVEGAAMLIKGEPMQLLEPSTKVMLSIGATTLLMATPCFQP